MNRLTKKITTTALTLFAGASLLAGCSNQALGPIRPGTAVNAQADANARYVISAQALIDKIATITDPATQEKLKKDFLPQIKPLNRYALQNLIKYSVKVLQAHLEPGQDPLHHPVAVLIYPLLERMLDVYTPFADRYMEMVMMAVAEDPATQEKIFAQFRAKLPTLAKTDLRTLLDILSKNEDGLFPPEAPLTQRLVQSVQAALNR
ncbi:MAG TPA: hypothetical protein V6D23_03425 [Candidatus Obscuribacterales bacterium]